MRFPIQAAAVVRVATALPVCRLPDGVVGLQTQTHTHKELEAFGFDHSKDCPGGNFWCFCPKSGSGRQNYACCPIKDPTDGYKSCNQTTTGDCVCT